MFHTQRGKKSNVAAASQLMWVSTLGQVGGHWFDLLQRNRV